MNRRVRQWGRLAAMTWRAGPARCVLVLTTYLADIIGQPLVALMLKDVTDAILRDDPGAAVRAGAIAALAWTASTQSFGIRALLCANIRDRVDLALSEETLSLTARIPGIGHLEDPHTLDRIEVALRSRAVADTLWAVADTVASLLIVVANLVVLSTASPLLMLTLPLAAPTLWLNRLGQRHIRRAMDAAVEDERTADSLVQTALDPIAAVELRITGAGRALMDEHATRWNRAAGRVARARARAAAYLAAGWLVFLLGIVGGLAYLVWRIGQGHGTPGDIVLLLASATQQQAVVQATVAGIGRMLDGVHAAGAYFWLRETADAEGPAPGAAPVPRRLTTGIIVDGVTFAYPGTERTVLQSTNLRLPAGSMVALVGAHGSGKTSLVKLLTGMYPPTTGSLTVDGVDLAQVDPAAWRSRTTVGFQDFVRYETPAREAVGVGDLPHADDTDRVQAAVDAGGARDVVDRLAEGLDTQLGTVYDGVNLSGGQWQKLALARTCMRDDPLLVVLDEPTASLDPVSEYEVFRRQVTLARGLGRAHGTVTVVISHRFSTVRMADKIVVLSEGSVVEEGTHAELMESGGMYARMYRLQQDSYTSSRG
ncbi:ABC transporter ATP-binding protein [Streptomyces sp. NPDC051572]|jgi:ATP-binding cassette subfamily B protein|uniref:ABC transporter ATP-binding protein n=1 Tax=unclassified Streptomyces TaxID=2593676 RepID=UPI0034505496